MELTEGQKKQLKILELDLLKKVISVCEKLNLEYYIIGGTLIGAVRHKGFIPWDDDIDIAMKRKDYDVFVSRAQQFLPEGYFVQTFKTEKGVPFNFCKLRNSNTTLIERSLKNFKINHGVGLDIFPLDYYPETKKAKKRFEFKKRLLTTILSKKFYSPNLNFWKKAKRFIVKSLFVFFSIEKIVIKREKLYKSVKKSNTLANLSGAWGEKEIAPIEWFSGTVEMEFEGLKVKAPVGYDQWLKQVYGDYMKLPPKEKRVAHHYIEKVDFDKSYKEFIK